MRAMSRSEALFAGRVRRTVFRSFGTDRATHQRVQRSAADETELLSKEVEVPFRQAEHLCECVFVEDDSGCTAGSGGALPTSASRRAPTSGKLNSRST